MVLFTAFAPLANLVGISGMWKHSVCGILPRLHVDPLLEFACITKVKVGFWGKVGIHFSPFKCVA
uniref:Uncharacterized protein n=1 Tax=Arundo donax TaxID=35708 RepID=A0A0A9DCD1_ARUDO